MKVWKILKYIFILVLLLLIGFLILRIAMNADRSTLDEVYPTNAAVSAYQKSDDRAFLTHKIPHDISEDGYFTAYALSYSRYTKELQITVRYNDGLYEKYLEGSDPDKYYFELRDAEGNTVATSTTVATKERYFYNHLRLAFADVEIYDDTELYLFLCCDEKQYPAEHTKGILIEHEALEFKPLKLNSGEKEALSGK